MSKYKYKKKSEQTPAEATPVVEEKPIYGFLIFRSGLGWRTKLIKAIGEKFEIVKVSEPDTKLNALYKGECWIDAQTAK